MLLLSDLYLFPFPENIDELIKFPFLFWFKKNFPLVFLLLLLFLSLSSFNSFIKLKSSLRILELRPFLSFLKIKNKKNKKKYLRIISQET